ncbi:RagB/SusD family nutrient uptake outer membrane protein [Hymenobacter sp. BT491]|uniref:RagB/SusD family nutrient uptake outer membrane protein n=1 Tax=Hymenobacter sp. BT491 TaxID=2766779 RepID=UPI0016539158|nr:RagB/SusD family nutrient uptake outer membrane protein [Hymenobacter sp. BT491]MBC6990922.1 RagB/SusD family nutrient uptake outer membrane protein [Hymenobacter sp. BT491]
MKTAHAARLIAFTVLATLSQGCKSFLDKEPLGTTTQDTLFRDPLNAVQAVNAIYDVASWDQGPKWGDPNGQFVPQTYEWMFGDVMSDDAAKGSSPSDFPTLTELKTWNIPPSNPPVTTLWVHSFTGIARANSVINNIDAGTIDAALKTRLKGEALFLRAYFYFNLVKSFGGVPLFDKTVSPKDAANVTRASIAETYAFLEKDLKAAATMLPEKDGYAAADLGRATKGAANGYLARAIMYQLGTVNGNNHTWQEVYDLTNTVITSGKYSLLPNYAQIHQTIGENSSESIFEIQFATSNDGYGPIMTGTTNNIFQNNRKTFGYGFNNPTQNLVNEFEPNDPRLECTVIKNGDVVLGIKNVIDMTENETGYLSRKVAIIAPNNTASGPQNIRKMRYADILLMKAEAAAQTSKNAEAVALVNQVRQRARTSTRPPGTTVGSLAYEPANTPAGTLPDLSTSLSGPALLNAIWHERRVEFGEESLRLWDLIRTGRYMTLLPAEVRTRALARVTKETSVNPTPLLPIPLTEVQAWNLPQNPGY